MFLNLEKVWWSTRCRPVHRSILVQKKSFLSYWRMASGCQRWVNTHVGHQTLEDHQFSLQSVHLLIQVVLDLWRVLDTLRTEGQTMNQGFNTSVWCVPTSALITGAVMSFLVTDHIFYRFIGTRTTVTVPEVPNQLWFLQHIDDTLTFWTVVEAECWPDGRQPEVLWRCCLVGFELFYSRRVQLFKQVFNVCIGPNI